MSMELFIIQLMLAFFGTLAFSILFHVPKEQYMFCGLAGTTSWFVYLMMHRVVDSLPIVSFAAVIVLTIVARTLAAFRRTPITVFLFCGIFPLVPGAGIYYTVYHFIMGDTAMASFKGMETLKIALALSLGIVLVLSLPYSIFNVFNPDHWKKKNLQADGVGVIETEEESAVKEETESVKEKETTKIKWPRR